MLLAFSDKFGGQILPIDPTAQCSPITKGQNCFKAGDNRVNQQPILLSLQTLLLRNHNHHAMQLSLMNPHWNDDQLFQEARRITIAELQHITYNEYLPIILGPLLMHYYNLSPLINGFTQYESFTDPSTLNEFITAASRYGHSQIRDFYRLMTNYQNFSMIALRDHFLEPDFAYDGLVRSSSKLQEMNKL